MRFEREAHLALKAVSLVTEESELWAHPGQITTKGSVRDLVSEVDRQLNRRIHTVLESSGIPVLSEENESESKNRAVAENETFWVVDPLDGSVNFIHQLPFYGVSIGLIYRGEPVVGAISLPVLKDLYFTHGSSGAFRNGKRITFSPVATLENALVASSFSGKSFATEFRAKEYKLFGRLNDCTRGALRTGCSVVNLCALASGSFQLVYGFHIPLWDIAAGLAIAKQAGVEVIRVPSGHPLRVHFFAGSKELVQEASRFAREEGLLS